jgi:hypothetical protein
MEFDICKRIIGRATEVYRQRLNNGYRIDVPVNDELISFNVKVLSKGLRRFVI